MIRFRDVAVHIPGDRLAEVRLFALALVLRVRTLRNESASWRVYLGRVEVLLTYRPLRLRRRWGIERGTNG